MKFVFISDTHGLHDYLLLPKGDVLIHAGDISKRGSEHEVRDFLKWFEELNFEHKIFIAGNHDFYFEDSSPEKINQLIPKTVTYLCDSGIQLGNFKIWGSPVTPWFFDWAFNRNRGLEIKSHWDLIPADTDILITHGPVFGVLDATARGELVGCKNLLDKVEEVNPKIHVCGHIHEAYGICTTASTTFINASILDQNYKVRNLPIVMEL